MPLVQPWHQVCDITYRKNALIFVAPGVRHLGINKFAIFKWLLSSHCHSVTHLPSRWKQGVIHSESVFLILIISVVSCGAYISLSGWEKAASFHSESLSCIYKCALMKSWGAVQQWWEECDSCTYSLAKTEAVARSGRAHTRVCRCAEEERGLPLGPFRFLAESSL